MAVIKISEVVWDAKIYPRKKWATTTIEKYADAIEAGDEFPPIVLEEGTNRLIDGKHRLEAYKKAGKEEIPAEWHKIPDDTSVKYYAATLSAKHGDRLTNADIKTLAEEEFENDPDIDPIKWGKKLGISKSTVYRYVSHILNRQKAGREAKAWHLSKLGWTQEEIAGRLGVDQGLISKNMKNSHLGKIHNLLGEGWNDKGIAETANRLDLSLTDCYAAAISELSDEDKLKKLNIKIQPYDVWNFSSCNDLMGDKHPGRIPGELVCHALYFFTNPGDFVLDPMAGSGTVLDACLLMDRKCRGYDIDDRHERIDIESHNLSDGWMDTAKKANLIFWDPPYFNKMDSLNIGKDGYIEGSISKQTPGEYKEWINQKFTELYERTKADVKVCFLMSDWDSENDKNFSGHEGIFLWDYADMIKSAGWKIRKQIQCPLSSQQVHPDIVNKFRKSRRLARLCRYLLVIEK